MLPSSLQNSNFSGDESIQHYSPVRTKNSQNFVVNLGSGFENIIVESLYNEKFSTKLLIVRQNFITKRTFRIFSVHEKESGKILCQFRPI